MAITKVSNSGFKSGMTKYDSFLAGNDAYDPAATWLIQRITATGGETSITFSSIPQTYKHLQLRIISRTSTADDYSSLYITYNNDGSASYRPHNLTGNGSSAYAGSQASAVGANYISNANMGSGQPANCFAASIIDILDYTNTSKNKTLKAIVGKDANTASTIYRVGLISSAWFSTSAITSIQITASAGGNFVSGSTFALYGMVG